MRHVQNTFDATTRPRLCGYLVATSAAWLAIGPATGATPTAPPTLFGWQRLAIVHVLLALPICAVGASGAVRWLPTRRRGAASLVFCGAGLIVGLFVAAILPGLTGLLGGSGTGFWLRAFVQSAICVGLELPWCLAAEALTVIPRSTSRRSFATP